MITREELVMPPTGYDGFGHYTFDKGDIHEQPRTELVAHAVDYSERDYK